MGFSLAAWWWRTTIGGPVCVVWVQAQFRRVSLPDGQGVRGGTAVVEEPALTFAGLLRQLRTEARLTQEELAEAAGLSPRSVSDLERGINRTARKETAVLLADALGLPGTVAELFVAAARGRGSAQDVVAARQGTALGAFAAAATRGLPRDVASFTGRQADLDRLVEGLETLATGGGVVGICAAATPAVSSRLDSASAGSTGRWPRVWACNGK